MKYQTKYSITSDGRKLCRSCNEVLAIDNFSVNKSTSSGLEYACRQCKSGKSRETYKASPKPTRSHLRARYGISTEIYEEMFKSQDGKCSICHNYFPELNVDHCHSTGEVRGLLCHNCNIGLGWFKDDIEALRSAIKYLVRS